MPAVLGCRPSRVVVLIGGNDVLALVSKTAQRFFRVAKHLPTEPSPECENLRAIAQRLKTEVPAAIALCSLPPIGEDPASADPFQHELNRRIEECQRKHQGNRAGGVCRYLPVYETMLAQIVAAPGRAFTRFRFLPFYRDAFRVFVLRKSPDEVARLNGWHFHTDGVHLNSRGGMIVADLVQEFIDG